MSTISRRAFLKTVGVGALSVAAMSVLAGCEGVPGTSSTGTALTTTTGEAGVTYRVSDLVTVRTGGSNNSTLDVAIVDAGNSDATWKTVYEKAYVTKAKELNSSVTKYDDLTSEQKTECKAAAEKAVADLEDVEHTVKFKVTNYGSAPIFVASESNASNTSGCVFTASSNGVALKCTVGKGQMVVNNDSKEADVNCIITLPLNTEKFDIIVTAPDATRVMKYTFTNTKYQDPAKIDPSKISSWS